MAEDNKPSRLDVLEMFATTALREGFSMSPYKHKDVKALIDRARRADELEALEKKRWEEELMEELKPKPQSNLRDHMIREIGILEALEAKDETETASEAMDNYARAIYESVSDLMEVFINAHHSGMSASITLSMFEKLARFEALSPLTADPREWIEHDFGVQPNHQSKRSSSVFSDDGLKTWYDINKPRWFNRGKMQEIIPFAILKRLPKTWRYKSGKLPKVEPGPVRGN